MSPERPEVTQAIATLSELRLPTNGENIAALQAMRRAPQLPQEFPDIIQNLHNPSELAGAMQRSNISYILHSEGPTVWNHVELAVRNVNGMGGLDEKTRADLRLLTFYHDLGKTVVYNSPFNRTRTDEKRKIGKLVQSMAGHERELEPVIRRGLAANGIRGEELEMFVRVIQAHMLTIVGEGALGPSKLTALIDSFGTSEEAQKRAVNLLTLLMKIDVLSTIQTTLTDGQVKIDNPAKKTEPTPELIWARYAEARK